MNVPTMTYPFLAPCLTRDRTKRYSPKRTHATVNVTEVNPKNPARMAKHKHNHNHNVASASTSSGSPNGPTRRFSSCETDQQLRQPLSGSIPCSRREAETSS